MTRAEKILEHIKHLSADAYKVQQDKVRRLNIHRLQQDQETNQYFSMRLPTDLNQGGHHSSGVLT